MSGKKKLLDKIIHDIAEQGVLEAVGDSISIQDANLMILYQNEVSIKIIGNHVGEYCYKAYEGNHKICKGCPLTLSFKDGKIHRTVRSVSLGKRIEHFEITASPIRDPSGKIVAGVEVARNVTKQKEAEKSLKDSAYDAMPLCSVESCDVKSKLLYIQTTRYLYCSYMKIYDTGFICTCPIRYEIYKRYHC